MPAPLHFAVDEAEVVSERADRTIRGLTEHPALDATVSRYGPGQRGPGPHIHRRHVDAFYVLEGELQFGVGPSIEPVRATAGTFVLVPPNVVHAFDNTSDAPACWLNFHAPSTGFMSYLRGDGTFDGDDPPALGGGRRDTVVVSRSGAETPRLSAAVTAVASGERIELPSAPGELDAAFVIEGELEAGLNGAVVRVQAGAWIWATPDRPTELRGRTPAKLLRIRVPVDAR